MHLKCTENRKTGQCTFQVHFNTDRYDTRCKHGTLNPTPLPLSVPEGNYTLIKGYTFACSKDNLYNDNVPLVNGEGQTNPPGPIVPPKYRSSLDYIVPPKPLWGALGTM